MFSTAYALSLAKKNQKSPKLAHPTQKPPFVNLTRPVPTITKY
jgi:hypothetical protein